jgi:translation initiation factor 1
LGDVEVKFKLEGLKDSNGWSVDAVCQKCNENKSECRCNDQNEIVEPQKHSLVFRLEKRNGKPVTVIYPFHIDEATLKETLTKLKKSLGVGGAIKDNEVELQGNLKEKAKAHLEKLGFMFKK